MKRKSGFTLVEFAVVIIVIGLMIGGILKVRELITTAKIKNLEGTIDSLTRAISTYQERFQALPGDDDQATKERWGSEFTEEISLGNKNGIIDHDFDSLTNDDESRLVWLHLRCAKLIPRVSTSDSNQTFSQAQQQQPRHVFHGTGLSDGMIGISTDYIRNGAQGNQTLNVTGEFIGLTQIPGNIAVILELRLDDGKADTGRIRSDHLNYDGNNQSQNEFHKLYFPI